MAENADVQYTIRADSSQLETDLNQAENLVRQSAERTEQELDKIAEAVSGMQIIKELYVKGRLINIVVKPQ